MFNLDWPTFIQALLPYWWRKPNMIAWLRTLLSAVIGLYDDLVTFRSRTIYDLQITGQTIYLEKALNDRFDFINRQIYIENLADLTQFYIYNKVEAQPPVYLYNKYDATYTYASGEFAAYQGTIWVANNATTGSTPAIGNANWSVHKPFDPYLINKGEALQPTDFIVWVPVALVFDINELRALVNRYKLAGKRYTVQTY